ncbi:lactonase family protein [Aeromicrobium sp. P5_D10]
MTMQAYVGSASSGSGVPDGAVHLLTIGTGGVELSSCITGLSCNPSYLALHPDRHTLYGVDEAEAGRVIAWRVDPETPGRLEQVGGPRSSGGAGPCHLVMHGDGGHILVANYGDGSVSALPVRADGSLGEPSHVIPGQASGHAHMVAVDTDREQTLTVDLGTDRINRYRFGDGRLEPIGSISIHAGGGPRHLVIRDGFAYVACELDSTISVVDLRSNTEITTVSTLPPRSTETSYPSAIRMSSDGRFLYVGNRGPDTITRFAVRGAEVVRVDEVTSGGDHPRDLVLSPDGRHLVVANQVSGNLSVLAVARDGSTAETIQTMQLPRASCIVWI